MRVRPFALVTTCFLTFSWASALLLAQDPEKAPFDPSKAQEGGLGMPSPYDKFLALNQLVEEGMIDWRGLYRGVAVGIDPDQWSDTEVGIPLVLGLRIADGIMAIQARDAELLSGAANDIEKLAMKLGVTDEELERARTVRTYANQGEWLRVFMELGFLQQDILKTVARAENSVRGDLMIASGWLQGARYTTQIVLDNYGTEVSNTLREPLMVDAIAKKLQEQPASTKETAPVAMLLSSLPEIKEIINVGLDDPVPQAGVERIKQLADAYAQAVLNSF